MRAARNFLLGVLSVVMAGCAPGTAVEQVPLAPSAQSVILADPVRSRAIPVHLYGAGDRRPRPLALLSHGYGGRNTDYEFLASHLAQRGYLVASVQQQLATDPPLPSAGEPRIVRRPSWEQGVVNLLFVRRWLIDRGMATEHPVLLVGHSHGGDTSMLFAELHPDLTRTVYSLDSRRQPFPRRSSPRICSVRSSDHEADPGVIPPLAEQQALGMLIVQADQLPHNDMWDGATPEQRVQMIAALDLCLNS